MEQIKLGKYRHFKGMEVEVILVGKHSETLEDYVVYIHPTEDPILGIKDSVWVRPLNMFLETIERDGNVMKRFEFIGE